MATSRTRNLRLFLSSGLSTEAKANLEILDRLGGVYQVDNSEAVNIRSKTDIRLLPGDSSAGGLGNSNLQVGSEATPVNEFKVWANIFELNGSLRLPDYLTPSLTRKYLTIRYDSSAQGAADTAANRELLLDVQNGDRKLILAQDLELAGSFSTKLNTTAATDITLPVTGTLATLAGTETLTNKTISANNNTIEAIKNASIASDAAIAYSKLNLVGQVKNADVSPTAAIAATKIAVAAIANISATDLQSALLELQQDIDTRAKDNEFDAHTGTVAAHGISSAIVGTQEIQTLTNKTLLSPTITTPLGITKADVGLGNVDNLSAAQLAVEPRTLQNKSLSGQENTFSAIPYSALSITNEIRNVDIDDAAGIVYGKLDLTGSLRNADWSSNPSYKLAGTKVDADFGIQFIKSESGLKIGQTFTTTLGVQSQIGDLSFNFPQNAGGLNYVLATDGAGNTKWIASSSTGTVSKVGLLAPSILSVTTRDGSGTPIAVQPGDPAPYITATGYFDISLANQAQNLVLAAPEATTGAPTFRSLTTADLPAPLNSDAARNQAISDQVAATIKESTNNAITWSYNAGTKELRPTFSLAPYSTTNLSEGTNLYYLDSRVATKAKNMIATNTGAVTGVTIAHGVGPDSISFTVNQAAISTDNITEGTRKFFTDELAQDAVNALLLESTEIAKAYDDYANSLVLTLKTTGVTSGSYGSASQTVNIAVDSKGRITSAAQQSISITASQISDFNSAVNAVTGASFTATWTTGTTLAVTHNLGSRDVLIQIYSLDTFEDILVSSIVRTTLNSIDLTASEAPTGLGWKVLIRRI